MAPVYIMIDQAETGRNIRKLMQQSGIRVKDLQEACGFDKPQAVYKWLHGQSLPTIDNLLILARVFHTNMEGILAVSGDALPQFTGFISERMERTSSFCKLSFFIYRLFTIPRNRGIPVCVSMMA